MCCFSDSSSGNETFNLSVLNELRKSIRERGVSSSSTTRPRIPSHANSGTITGDSSTTPSTSKHSTPQHRQKVAMQQDHGTGAGGEQQNGPMIGNVETFGGIAGAPAGHIYVNIHYAHIHQPLLSSSASDPRIAASAAAAATGTGTSPNATLNGVGPAPGAMSVSNSRPKQSNGSSSTSFSNQPVDDLRQPRVCLNESNNNSLILLDHHYSQIDKFRPHGTSLLSLLHVSVPLLHVLLHECCR